jgi:hypothetical protein
VTSSFPFDGIFIFCEVVFAARLRDVNPLDAECFAFSLISFILSPTEKTFFITIDGDGGLCCCCCRSRCWSSICVFYECVLCGSFKCKCFKYACRCVPCVCISLSLSVRESSAVSLFAWARLASTFFFCFVLLKGRRSRDVCTWTFLTLIHQSFVTLLTLNFSFFGGADLFADFFNTQNAKKSLNKICAPRALTIHTQKQTHKQPRATDSLIVLLHIYIYTYCTHINQRNEPLRAREKKKKASSPPNRERQITESKQRHDTCA